MWRVLRGWALGVAIGLIAGVAHAQDNPPDGEPTASVGAIASGLIGDADAEGVFEVMPAEQVVAVRHGRSGLTCRLDPNNRNRLLVFPQAARGEDVACDSTDGTESITFYATRFSFEVTPRELIEGAATAIRQRFPDARELPAPANASSAGLPASTSAAFMVTREGAPTYTRVTVAIVGQWVIKLRYSLTAPDDSAIAGGEAAANRIWNATLSELMQQRL